MHKTKQAKTKRPNKKTVKNILVTLSNATSLVVNDPLVTKAALKVETSPTPTNMKAYAAIVGATTVKIASHSSYNPSINKLLASIRSQEYTDIFGCGAESALRKSRVPDEFNIRIGDVRDVWKSKCVPATSSQARAVFLKNFKINKPLVPSNIIAPMQRYTNCWFNTMFMCFFVSDKGRKFMRFFRQIMIEGKLLNGKLIEPKELSYAFILLNASIEACYNNGIIRNTNWLALNTNNIIASIHNAIANTDDDIKNVNEYGNPYKFYRAIMRYLDVGKSEVAFVNYQREIDVENFFNSNKKTGATPDIIMVSLFDDGLQVQLATASKYKHKPLKLNYNGADYELESVICRDVTKNHFCCGLRCNSIEYLYDGDAFSKLSKRSWQKFINKDYDWWPRDSGSGLAWNFMRGYSMFLYYRTK